MTEVLNSKQYNLENRTFEFAKNIRSFIKNLPKNLTNNDDKLELERIKHIDECTQLMKIFGAILEKVK